MDELKATVDTLVELDEPEALLTTLKRAAQRKPGPRWAKLAQVLAQAEDELKRLLGQPGVDPAMHNPRPSDSEAKIA
jgi:uncharacterized protein YceH (UPF0502 family)